MAARPSALIAIASWALLCATCAGQAAREMAAGGGKAAHEASAGEAAGAAPGAARGEAVTPGADSAAWPLFASDELGLELRHPPGYAPLVDRPGGEAVAIRLRVRFVMRDQLESPLADRLPGQFALVLFDNPERLTLEGWLDAAGWPFAPAGRSVRPVEVAGRAGLEVTTRQMLAPRRFVYLLVAAGVLRIAPTGPGAEEMLASLRLRD